jgi:hypothetical protein
VEGERIARLKSPLFTSLYAIWHDYHVLHVLPHGRGTLDERPVVIRWIKQFEAELASLQRWERDREKEKLPVCRAERRYS